MAFSHQPEFNKYFDTYSFSVDVPKKGLQKDMPVQNKTKKQKCHSVNSQIPLLTLLSASFLHVNLLS